MGRFKKLLAGVSSLGLLVGASQAKANVDPLQTDDEQLRLQVSEFVKGSGTQATDVNDPYHNPEIVELAIEKALDTPDRDQLFLLPLLVRHLRAVGLNENVEVAAVDTVLTIIERQRGSLISADEATDLMEKVLEDFAGPIRVADNRDWSVRRLKRFVPGVPSSDTDVTQPLFPPGYSG